LRQNSKKQERCKKLEFKPVAEAINEGIALIPSPAMGTIGALALPGEFNLIFQTHVESVSDDTSIAYFSPEIGEGTFVNCQKVIDTTQVKILFGIAQMARPFRNEITPRNFALRSREFEQMELEFFIDDSEEALQNWHEYWMNEQLKRQRSIGICEDLLGLDVHKKEKLANYSKTCTDITFKYPLGVKELEGVAAPGILTLCNIRVAVDNRWSILIKTQKENMFPML
jgi:glycyl-tRNA synthetase